MWYRCDYGLSDVGSQRLFGSAGHGGVAFRKLTAKLSDEYRLGLPSAVLNYEGGNPRQTPPCMRFLGFARGVAIVGIGMEGATLAREVAPTIHAALTRRANSLISVHERSGETRFAPVPMQLPYFVKSAVLCPTKGVKRWLDWVDEARASDVPITRIQAANEAIQKSIEASLMRQIDWLDPDEEEREEGRGGRSEWNLLKDSGDEYEMVKRASRPFKVEVHTCGRSFLESRVNHESRQLKAATGIGPAGSLPLVGIHGLEISINADLEGVWQVGRLTSSGYGLLLRSSRATEVRAAA